MLPARDCGAGGADDERLLVGSPEDRCSTRTASVGHPSLDRSFCPLHLAHYRDFMIVFFQIMHRMSIGYQSGQKGENRNSEVDDGSVATFLARSPDVCLYPDSGGIADILQPPLGVDSKRRPSLHSEGSDTSRQSAGGACTSIFLFQQMGRSWPNVQ